MEKRLKKVNLFFNCVLQLPYCIYYILPKFLYMQNKFIQYSYSYNYSMYQSTIVQPIKEKNSKVKIT